MTSAHLGFTKETIARLIKNIIMPLRKLLNKWKELISESNNWAIGAQNPKISGRSWVINIQKLSTKLVGTKSTSKPCPPLVVSPVKILNIRGKIPITNPKRQNNIERLIKGSIDRINDLTKLNLPVISCRNKQIRKATKTNSWPTGLWSALLCKIEYPAISMPKPPKT